MRVKDARIGTRVKSNRPFAGVPEGTEGVIDEKYGIGVMVAWDLPEKPLPPGYRKHDGEPAFKTGILRDGFSHDELKFLDRVVREEVTEAGGAHARG